MLITTLAILCIAVMFLSLGLHLFGLPANWIVLALAAIWCFTAPGTHLTWPVLLLLSALAILGEILEFFFLAWGGKKYGGSGKGTIGGMIGAFIGAILGAPFLLGIGAFFGALAGAFAGSLVVELLRGMKGNEALRAAWGSLVGRFGGTMLKADIGFAMVAIAAPTIWPS